MRSSRLAAKVSGRGAPRTPTTPAERGPRTARTGCPPGRGVGRALIPGVLSALLVAAPVGAAFEFRDAGWEGASELSAIARDKLGKSRVRVVPAIAWDELQPIDAVLVLHPEHELDYREVEAFLEAGGRLALLDDYGKGDALLRQFRIHRVRAPLEPRGPLRGNPNLPIAVPPAGAPRPHPLVEGVDRVVTNHPTGLETDRELRLTTVLELPAATEAATAFALIGVIGDAKRCGLVSDAADEAAPGPLATGRCGRLFAMGDPSAVMNSMLRYPGNRAFAARLIAYLVDNDTWGRRGGTLYLVANTFTERGNFGKRPGLGGAIDERVQALARLVADTRRDGMPAALAIGLAALTAAGAALWAIAASTRRYRRTSPRYARSTPLVAQGGLAGRAAVIAADTTHRALAVLELKAALEEALRERLGKPGASLPQLLEEIDRQDGLSRRNSEALRDVVAEMVKAEAAVARTESIRVSGATVRRMHAAMTAALSDLDTRGERRP